MENKKTILLVFGTRPEAIKMAPLVKKLQSEPEKFKTVVRNGMQFRYIYYWRKWFHCSPVIWLISKTESVLKRKLFGI